MLCLLLALSTKALGQSPFSVRTFVEYGNGKYQVAQGWFFMIPLGFNTENLTDENDMRVSSNLPLLYGRHFDSNYSIGLGLSFEFNKARVSGFSCNTQFVPLFAYRRYYFDNNRRRPLAFVRIGYGFKAEDREFSNDHEGGMNYQGGMEMHFA